MLKTRLQGACAIDACDRNPPSPSDHDVDRAILVSRPCISCSSNGQTNGRGQGVCPLLFASVMHAHHVPSIICFRHESPLILFFVAASFLPLTTENIPHSFISLQTPMGSRGVFLGIIKQEGVRALYKGTSSPCPLAPSVLPSLTTTTRFSLASACADRVLRRHTCLSNIILNLHTACQEWYRI
jgi:hypothetical protein